MKYRTVLVIAHRLSSIINSDMIVVMEEGNIIDTGTTEELLDQSERFRQLYELQFST